MEGDSTVTIYSRNALTDAKKNHFSVKAAMAQVLRGGAVFEVTDPRQAKIVEEAGATCLLISEPRSHGILRMPDPSLVKEIKTSASIPVMARVRVGHFVEAQIMEAIGVDFIDESEVLALADEDNYINKHNFTTPFSCGCHNLGGGLRRIREGATIIRYQGEGLAGGGNICEAVKSVRNVMKEVRVVNNMDEDEVFSFAKKIAAPYDLVAQTKQMSRLPVVQFAAGGIVTPADAAMMMQLGCDGAFIGNEIFQCGDPFKKARAIVQAIRHYNDPHVLVECSSGLEDGISQSNINVDRIEQ